MKKTIAALALLLMLLTALIAGCSESQPKYTPDSGQHGSDTLHLRSGVLVENPWEANAYLFCTKTAEDDYIWENFYLPEPIVLDGIKTGISVVISYDSQSEEYRDVKPAEAEFTLEDVKKSYQESCRSFEHEELMRTTILHQDERLQTPVEVLEIAEESEQKIAFLAEKKEEDESKGRLLYITYTRHFPEEETIQVGDTLQIYGENQSVKNYTTKGEKKIKMPWIEVRYLEKTAESSLS